MKNTLEHDTSSLTNSPIEEKEQSSAHQYCKSEVVPDNFNTKSIPPERTIVEVKDNNNEELESILEGMRTKYGGLCKCDTCGKENKDKYAIKKHIEGKHLEGFNHECSLCGKSFRLRNSLSSHFYQKHKK